jgi:hypothetical protein
MPAARNSNPKTSPALLTQQAYSLAQAGRVHEARDLFRQVVDIEPDNVDHWSNLGSINCLVGNTEAGVDCYARALELSPTDANARQNMLIALAAQLNEATLVHDIRASIDISRRILRYDPDDLSARVTLQTALWTAKERSELGDYAPHLRPGEIGTKILIACMPKSGSSWLFNAMLAVSGFPEDRYASGFLQNEQEVFAPRVVKTATENGVIQQHCRATAPNLQILQAFGIRPVVLVRNVFDALVSMHDFYMTGATRNTFLERDWHALDAGTRLDLVVETVAPWYVQFYASWQQAIRWYGFEAMELRYEDMIADKPAAVAAVCDHCRVSADPGKIAAAVAALDGETTATRFNKGVAGRGETTFSDAQKDRVRALTRFYPSIDFSPVGL